MEIKFTQLNKNNFSSGTYWKRILFIVVAAFAWLILIHIFLEMDETSDTIQPNTIDSSNSCMYYPSSAQYSLKLIPKVYSPPLNELPQDDYTRLINLKDFAFILNQPEKCSNQSVFLLLLISTAPQHQNLRDIVRATWGQEDVKVKRIFLLGATTDEKVQKSIESENQIHGDLIQGNFIDTYKNLTYKTIMALKYGLYHCPNAVYTLKLDDDIFVNMPLMKNYLTNDLSPFGALNLLQCIVLRNRPPIRNKASKWYVSEEIYAQPYYPNYCQGPYALMSPDVIFRLYKEAQKLPYLYLEDVFTYGFAASRVTGLNHSNIYRYTLGYYKASDIPTGIFDESNFLFGPYEMTGDDIRNFWKYVINRPVRSSIYDHTRLGDL